MTASADLRSCLADLTRLREEYTRITYRVPVSIEADFKWRETRLWAYEELARLERVADGMLARMCEETMA